MYILFILTLETIKYEKLFFFIEKSKLDKWVANIYFCKKKKNWKKKLMEIASGYHKNVAETVATCVKISENVFAVINMPLDIS